MEINQLQFASDLPYPDVQAERTNYTYAKAMLDNIGGRGSEMSAVSLYFYNHLITSKYPDIATVFHHISIVEMHHLEIFGTLARQLGENPRLWAQRGVRKTYWSPSYNNYPMHLRELLSNCLLGEKETVKKYESQLRQIKDSNVCENLKRIILDEKIHIEIFRNLYHEYCL